MSETCVITTRLIRRLAGSILLLCLSVDGHAQQSDSTLTRGPYLQQSSSSHAIVRWRTGSATNAIVRYGSSLGNLSQTAFGSAIGTEHIVTLENLDPQTRYYYSIGDSNGELSSGADHYVDTHPTSETGDSTRIWVLGDSGTANSAAARVRDAYAVYNGDAHADIWLMLGDNAYNDGTDAQYQAAVFDFYPNTLRNSVLWSTLGNHDGHSAYSDSQSGPYFDIFSFPTTAQSGGISSGTEAYYSFDYGDIHFISLDSYHSDRNDPGPMATWLRNDLGATDREWIIAFWHHPPYTKGSHDSDSEARLMDMREVFLPILEMFGVDLVLGGHSHSYERSKLINSHYGKSDTFDSSHVIDAGTGDPTGTGAYEKSADFNVGAVYGVAGSSGKTTVAPLDHPVMIANFVELGSMVIDVQDNQLDAVFLNDTGAIKDRFRIVHTTPTEFPPTAPSALSAEVLSHSEIRLDWVDNASDESEFEIQRSLNGVDWSGATSVNRDTTSYTDTQLEAETEYQYRIVAINSAGSSAPSNTLFATTESAPLIQNYYVSSEQSIVGNVSANEAVLDADDQNVESIDELVSGGKPSRRISRLEHQWSIDMPSNSAAVIIGNAWSTTSSDGESFNFSWSNNNGQSWQSLFNVGSTNQNTEYTGLVSNTGSGMVLVRVLDSDRTQGNSSIDSVFIDTLFARVSTVPGDPPLAPTALTAISSTSSSIQLAWQDNALDEVGFSLERKLDNDADTWIIVNNGLDANSVMIEDTNLQADSDYAYRLSAFNAFGQSDHAVTTGSTMPGDGLTLVLDGRKRRSKIEVDLNWTGTEGSPVDITRNNQLLETVGSGITNYKDVTGLKGSQTLVYQVCSTGTQSCSDPTSITF